MTNIISFVNLRKLYIYHPWNLKQFGKHTIHDMRYGIMHTISSRCVEECMQFGDKIKENLF